MKKSHDQIMTAESSFKMSTKELLPPKKLSYARDFNKQDTYKTGRWSIEEKLLFLYGLSKFGKGKWKKIGSLLPTRSLVQIKSHAQKVMKRHEAGEDIFVTLDANRDFFDMVVLPASLLNSNINNVTSGKSSSKSKQARQSKNNFKSQSSIAIKKEQPQQPQPQRIMSSSSTMPQTPSPQKVRKTVTIVERDAAPATSGRHGQASIHYKTSTSPSAQSPTSLQRSIFQATLGKNGASVSFSFRSDSPTNSFDSSSSDQEREPASSSKSPNSPPPLSSEPLHVGSSSLSSSSSSSSTTDACATRQYEQQLAAAALCQLSGFLPSSSKSSSANQMLVTP
mmetsp:Transcript_23380/g.32759  ORF Transcript_23380/g.32759 Transcript_23380/m.32759 type:complete len:337 (+) Transcript_23380:454-1464(+)